jgi:hypothetical protein
MKLSTIEFVDVWSIAGSEVIQDLDFELTYGDGITLHPIVDVIDALRYETSARTLVNALHKLATLLPSGYHTLIGF